FLRRAVRLWRPGRQLRQPFDALEQALVAGEVRRRIVDGNRITEFHRGVAANALAPEFRLRRRLILLHVVTPECNEGPRPLRGPRVAVAAVRGSSSARGANSPVPMRVAPGL